MLAVHDQHVRTVKSALDAMSGDLVAGDMTVEARSFLRAARALASDEFGVRHVTIQVEDEDRSREKAALQV